MNPYRSTLTRYRKGYRGYKAILLSCLLTLLAIPLPDQSWTVTHKRHTQSQLVTAVAHRQGLNPRLLHSLVLVESSGKPSAISKKGAIGLSQVHWPTWKHRWSKKDLLDPEKNLIAGATILKQYMRESGSLDEALRKYSGGARDYARKVRKGMRG
jgi:soluble lytic murein transglycosylase-like protein